MEGYGTSAVIYLKVTLLRMEFISSTALTCCLVLHLNNDGVFEVCRFIFNIGSRATVWLTEL
jgi:hypothetical protein